MSMGTVHTKRGVHKGSESKLANFGKVIGSAIGAVVGGYYGGAKGATQGASIGGGKGAQIGGSVGAIKDPTREKDIRGIKPLESASAKMPEVQMAVLQNAKSALSESTDIPAPEMDQINQHLTMAQQNLRNRIK